jgi:hypothetical protein
VIESEALISAKYPWNFVLSHSVIGPHILKHMAWGHGAPEPSVGGTEVCKHDLPD